MILRQRLALDDQVLPFVFGQLREWPKGKRKKIVYIRRHLIFEYLAKKSLQSLRETVESSARPCIHFFIVTKYYYINICAE